MYFAPSITGGRRVSSRTGRQGATRLRQSEGCALYGPWVSNGPVVFVHGWGTDPWKHVLLLWRASSTISKHEVSNVPPATLKRIKRTAGGRGTRNGAMDKFHEQLLTRDANFAFHRSVQNLEGKKKRCGRFPPRTWRLAIFPSYTQKSIGHVFRNIHVDQPKRGEQQVRRFCGDFDSPRTTVVVPYRGLRLTM